MSVFKGHKAAYSKDYISSIRYYEAALVAYQAALDSAPNDPSLLRSCAKVYLELEKAVLARDSLPRRRFVVCSLLLRSSLCQQRLRESPLLIRADAFYRLSLEEAPEASALSEYGSFLDHCREYDSAETHFLRALMLDPNHLGALQLYATFLSEVRQSISLADRFFARHQENRSRTAAAREPVVVTAEQPSVSKIRKNDDAAAAAAALSPSSASASAAVTWRHSGARPRSASEDFTESASLEPPFAVQRNRASSHTNLSKAGPASRAIAFNASASGDVRNSNLAASVRNKTPSPAARSPVPSPQVVSFSELPVARSRLHRTNRSLWLTLEWERAADAALCSASEPEPSEAGAQSPIRIRVSAHGCQRGVLRCHVLAQRLHPSVNRRRRDQRVTSCPEHDENSPRLHSASCCVPTVMAWRVKPTNDRGSHVASLARNRQPGGGVRCERRVLRGRHNTIHHRTHPRATRSDRTPESASCQQRLSCTRSAQQLPLHL